MTTPQQFFIKEAVAHARQLPLADAVVFLRGMLESIHDEPAFAPIRAAFAALSQSDSHLELIESGQLTLPLEGRKKNGNGGHQ